MELQKQLNLQRNEQDHIWGHLQADRWYTTQKYAGHEVLDVGCANGIYVQELLNMGHKVIGVDLLPYDEWSYLPNTIVLSDARNLPFADNSFDTIISFETLEHVPDPETALAEYHRICTKNIIISVPNCDLPDIMSHSGLTFYHYIDRTHVNFFTPTSLKEMVENQGFKVQEIRPFNAVLPASAFLATLGIPTKYARKLGQWLNLISPKKYYMSLLLVASKV